MWVMKSAEQHICRSYGNGLIDGLHTFRLTRSNIKVQPLLCLRQMGNSIGSNISLGPLFKGYYNLENWLNWLAFNDQELESYYQFPIKRHIRQDHINAPGVRVPLSRLKFLSLVLHCTAPSYNSNAINCKCTEYVYIRLYKIIQALAIHSLPIWRQCSVVTCNARWGKSIVTISCPLLIFFWLSAPTCSHDVHTQTKTIHTQTQI